MSIKITCDVCSAEMPERSLIVFYDGDMDNPTDVCSSECLRSLADYLEPKEDLEPDFTPPPPSRKITPQDLKPKEPEKRYPTEDEIERMTGVTRRR